MKLFFFSLALLAVLGFGCTNVSVSKPLDTNWTRYESAEYGFTFGYPSNMEARQREQENRPAPYLGMDVDFFLSLRDTVKDTKPTNIAFFYAVPRLTVDAFTAALEASNANGAVKVTSIEDVEVNRLNMKKVTSTTEMGKDKTHYLFDRNGTLVIVSVFLGEEESWESVLATMDRL